ncbi:hypothetical protein UlMin_024862 [Ulmus minor]
MPKPKQRTLDHLYNATQMIPQPKITPVLRGSYRMQGPLHHDTEGNMVSSQSKKKSGKHSMSNKVHMRGESGACNVCSAPCSSCMHFSRALMGSKTEEFTDESCRINVATQYSVNGGDTSSSFKSKVCDNLQHTTSETSNPISVSSSHDSFSENADSKATLRSDKSDAVEVGMLRKLSLDDNVLCVSRSNGACVTVSNGSRDIEKKKLSCSSASASSLGLEESKKEHESILTEMPSSKDANTRSCSPQLKLPESNLGHIGSSLKEVAASDAVPCQKSAANSSDVPAKIVPKSEAETTNDGREPADQTLKCSAQDEKDGKSNELDVREPPLRSVSGEESDESDIVEHDVKVCDICGDAGREDLLAICSRCSDGAEHTYCMRKMLKSVPRGNWLCEECKFAEETNNQKQEMEGKRVSKATSSMQVATKRLNENSEVVPAAKRQALETSIGSPKSSSPIKMAALSRETSFKNLDKERVRPAQQASLGIPSANDVPETARSPVAGSRLQTSKGTLLKSKSFCTSNSKPKVKLVDEVVPQKLKGTKEHSSHNLKERPTRMMGKSMSFKAPNLGRSNASESKVKMLSSKYSHVDAKGLKQAKERTTFERKSLSKLDRPPVILSPSSTVLTPKADQTPRAESSLPSYANNRDSKVVQCEGKSSNLSKSTSNIARKAAETPVFSVGGSSVGGGSVTEPKLSQTGSKDEPLSTYSLTEKSPSSLDGTSQGVLPQSQEPNLADKPRENSGRPRPTVTTSSRSIICQKCKESGHTAESCTSSGTLQASGVDASAARSARDEMQRGSKLKNAIHAALLRKPEINRKKRALDHSDNISTSNMDLNCEIPAQDQTLVSNKSKKLLHPEATHEGQQAVVGISTSDTCKHTTVNSILQQTVPTADTKLSSKLGNSDAAFSFVGKPMAKDIVTHASAVSSQLLKMSAIPEYEYIWQGCFEVQNSANLLDSYSGFQAHLSTCASPRVLEVVGKFPQKLSLKEVPRLSTWPTQFYGSGAKEDNIALYFFAKDLESYDRNYKCLLDGMIKNDLALKGSFEGVELLIFPSNQLPENSQRWNMLFFLWGVFRARRVDCLDSSKKSDTPNLTVGSADRCGSAVVTSSGNLCSPNCIAEKSSACDTSGNVAVASNVPDKTSSGSCNEQKTSEPDLGFSPNSMLPDSTYESKCISNAGFCEEMRSTSPSLETSPSRNILVSELKPSVSATRTNSFSKGEKTPLPYDISVDRKDFLPLKILPVSKEEEGVTGRAYDKKFFDGPVGATVSFGDGKTPDGIKREKDLPKPEKDVKEEDGYVKREAALGRDPTAKGVDYYWSTERKRPHIDLSDPSPPVVTMQSMPWNGINNMRVEGEIVGKKQKTGPTPSDMYECSSYNNRNPFGGGNASKQKDLGPLLVEEKMCVEACDEKVIPVDLGSTEMRFFPVDPRSAKDPRQGNNKVVWGEDGMNDGLPNLELALGGAERRPQNKGLPFLVGSGEKKENPEMGFAEKGVDEKEDEVSASLSLSLGFPFLEKEEGRKKGVPKSEQVRGEREGGVNTSLILFGGFPEE